MRIFLRFIILLGISAFTYESSSRSDFDRDYTYQLSADAQEQTPFVGADLSMSVLEGYRYLDDRFSPEPDELWKNLAMMIPRLMVSTYVSTFQHEVFGHGTSVRQIGQGWSVRSYSFNLDGSGSTSILANRASPPQYLIAVDIAGMQATEVLSDSIKDRFLEKESINPTYAAAYLVSSTDQINYVFSDYQEGKGHDVQNYITGMNTIYGSGYLSKSKLRSRTCLNLLDPFLYYSLYSLGTGKDFEYPMIPIGDWKYLPGFRAVFTPYGLENKLINHFRTPTTPMQINFSQGTNKRGTSWSAEAIVDKVWSDDKFDLGFNVATWNQPKLFVSNVLQAPNKQGGSAEAIIRFNMTRSGSIYTSTGYKTAGFRLGYPLRSSVLFRAGLSYVF
ncbi:MAG: hypothetical protein WCG05_02545 [Alphaproteobacteria bacterium]